MPDFPRQTARSVLFVTLDSCRFDTFQSADTPRMDRVGPLHKAHAPGNFTYASHMAMFMGFTPGNASLRQSVVNPKFGKLFKMAQGGIRGNDVCTLGGRNIKEGFRRLGYRTLGTGAVAWFNPETDTSGELLADFDAFHYPGVNWALPSQLEWIAEQLRDPSDAPCFLFLNIGETHVPYYFQGAPWDPQDNPCVPFAGERNDAIKCRIRQRRALEWVDEQLAGLLNAFAESTILICADHGDCWGEDGLWEHGIHHPKVLEVPLLFRLGELPIEG